MNKNYAYNQKILFTLFLFLLVMGFLGGRFYLAQRKVNSALRVKILSLDKVKRTPMPWSRLTNQSIEVINKKAKRKNPIVIPTPVLTPVAKIDAIPISDQGIEELAITLTQNMLNINELDLSTIEKNIQIADEIISREPASYSAYKAKLISMIFAESKFDQKIDDYQFDMVLDDMAGFEVPNNSKARREAALIETTTRQLAALENKLDSTALLRDEVSTQSAALESTSPEYQELQLQNAQLAASEQVASENLENFQNNINMESSSSTYQNEDIVEVPFLRLLAKNDYVAVSENAQSFIEQFPDSPTGYYYLAKALELEGRTDDMIRVIDESNLSPEVQSAIEDRLDATKGEDPKRYWETLRF